MAVLLPKSQAIFNSKGRAISGGLFAVHHKVDSDRFINDRRPFNAMEHRLSWARLPHGSCLCQLILDKGSSVRGSGDDLRNFFYMLKHNEGWLARNVVGDGEAISGKLLADFGADPEIEYFIALRIICMGDLNAVDLAQGIHEQVLKDCGCMDPDDVIQYGHPPRSRTHGKAFT